MTKIILLFLFVSIHLNANILTIDDNTDFQTTIKYQVTIEDKDKRYSNEDILNNNFNHFTSKIKSSYTNSVFWTKSNIKNRSNKPLRIILRNIRAGSDYIDVAVYDANKTLKQIIVLGDKREQSTKEIHSTKSVFSMTFMPNEELTIISKYHSIGSMDLYFEIFSASYYGYIDGLENIILGIFGGIVIALMIYNFNVFLTFKEISTLYYILHSFFALCFIYSVSGMLYFLNIGIGLDFLTATTWFAPILMLIFLMFFIEDFFDLKKRNLHLYRLLYLFKAISVFYFALFIYGYIKDETFFINYSTGYLNVSFINCIVIFTIAFWGYWNNNKGAGYIIIAEGIYLLSVIYTSFVLKGEMNVSIISQLIMIGGILCEMIFFSLALNQKIKKMKQDFENLGILRLKEKQYTDYGKIVGNISHQWKQPLSFLSSEIMYLNTLKLLNKEDQIKDKFLDIAPKLNYTIDLMSQTINLFNEFYKNQHFSSKILIKDEMDKILFIYQNRMLSHNISCNIKCSCDTAVTGHRVSFLQIIITLLDNSIDEFERANSSNPTISINVIESREYVEILYRDNGDGIKGNLDMLFEPYFSTKNNNGGAGLHIVNLILSQKFDGTIKVKNEDSGILFTIKLKKMNQ